MPDTPPTSTLIHLIDIGGTNTCCGQPLDAAYSTDPGRVTCFSCRSSSHFKSVQRHHLKVDAAVAKLVPVKLSKVMADDAHLSALREEADAKFDLPSMRNHRNMFVIEEYIHHGNYRSRRTVEVYDINAVTVDAVLQSSAYCYGSWLHAEAPHTEHRRAALHQLVEDLRHGRTNRAIGWSTFRLV